MRNTLWMALIASGVLGSSTLLGCGGGDGGGSPLDAVPDFQAVALEVTGEPVELAPSAAADAALPAALTASDWPATGADLREAQKKIAAVNTALRLVFARVEEVVLLHGAPTPGGATLYGGGPDADRCTIEVAAGGVCPPDASANFRLWVGRGPLGYAGAFVLQARPAGSTDETAFRTVAAGTLARGPVARRGHGRIWLDLDALRLAAPAYPGKGRLYGGFHAGPGTPARTRAETLVLVGFTPDEANADWPAATVAFRGVKTAQGTARVRVAGVKDLVTTGSDTELGLAHVVYDPSLGGRAFALVGDYTADGVPHGDVPAGHYFFGRSCYAAHHPEAPVFKQWFYCPTSQRPVECALHAGDAVDPNPSWIETGTSWDECAIAGEPAEFAPPTAAPTADPAQPAEALPGEGGELTPDAPPTEGDPLPAMG